MLPSSYTRRLRTQDLIQHKLPNIPLPQSTSSTFARVSFVEAKYRHGYLPRLLRERTNTHHGSRVSGKINQVLQHLSDVDTRRSEEEEDCRKKLEAVFYGMDDTPSPYLAAPSTKITPISTETPTKKKTTTVQATFVPRTLKSKSTNATPIVSTSTGSLKENKSPMAVSRDKLQPGLNVNKQRSRVNIVSRETVLQPINETKENALVTYVKKNGNIVPKVIPDTKKNLTRERMIVLAKTMFRDKRVSMCYGRNQNRIGLLTPFVCEGTPPWCQEVKSEMFVLVPIRSLCFMKWKMKTREVGYLEIDLPLKHARAKKDIYEDYRTDDGKYLSTSKLNKALVGVFIEALEIAQQSKDLGLLPELNFDYLNDTIELVYTKFLRLPLIPMLFIGRDEPYYSIKPNIPDLDPTSDSLFRAFFMAKEENILSKISSTDHGLRLDALKVVHTLCIQDWRLQVLSVYHLKNVLMHDIDFEIDNSPRWQRLTRDICVQSLLKRLLYFVKKKRLPHFFQSDFNLFSRFSVKTLRFMETPLERLVSNEPQLLRDLQRAARSKDYDDSSSSDEDWW